VLITLDYTKNRNQEYTFRMRPRRCIEEASTQLCWYPLASCLPRLLPTRHKDDARILGDTSMLSLVVRLALRSLAVALRRTQRPYDRVVDVDLVTNTGLICSVQGGSYCNVGGTWFEKI
jgi:hypothetical protein